MKKTRIFRMKKGYETKAYEDMAHGLKVLFAELQKPTRINLQVFWRGHNVPFYSHVGRVMVKNGYINEVKRGVYQWKNGEPSLHVAKNLIEQCRQYRNLKAGNKKDNITKDLQPSIKEVQNETACSGEPAPKHYKYWDSGVLIDKEILSRCIGMVKQHYINERMAKELGVDHKLIFYYIREAMIQIAQEKLNMAWGRIVEIEKREKAYQTSITSLEMQVEIIRRKLNIFPKPQKERRRVFHKIRTALSKVSIQSPIRLQSFIKISK